MSETAGGTTTKYLVDTLNPTGYSQVMDELMGGSVTRTFSYGLRPISENQLGGAIISEGGGGTGVNLADWLGTVHAFYSYTGGNLAGTPPAHAPFGESYLSSGNLSDFTGQQSDDITTNTTYYFPQRQYRSSQGRWLSPDPAGLGAVDFSNPQSWNRYAYVINSPLNNVDPQGTFVLGIEWALYMCGFCSFGSTWSEFDVIDLAFSGSYQAADPSKPWQVIGDDNGTLVAGGCDGCYNTELPQMMTVYPHIGLLNLLNFSFTNIPFSNKVTPQKPPCSTNCHTPNYNKPRSCDVDACTPAQKAQWCANAKQMADLGLKVTGQSGLGPLVSVGLGNLAVYLEGLGGPLTVVGNVQGNAANMANYVDSVCKGD